MKYHTCIFIILAGTLLPVGAADWFGTVDSNFNEAQNWCRQNEQPPEPPMTGVENKTRLVVQNGSGAPLEYTAELGDTTFKEQFLVGQNHGQSGEIRISGGRLVVVGAIIGQTKPGTVIISDGSLDLTGSGAEDRPDSGQFDCTAILGNEPEGVGNVEVSGGTLDLEKGLMIGRHSGYGTLTISGNGKVTCGGPTVFGQGDHYNKIMLGEGAPVFQQMEDGNVYVPSGDAGNSCYISFTKGSKGHVALQGRDKAAFDKLVADGVIRIEESAAKPEQFVFEQSGDLGILRLAPQ